MPGGINFRSPFLLMKCKVEKIRIKVLMPSNIKKKEAANPKKLTQKPIVPMR